jgi:hypothetical protein
MVAGENTILIFSCRRDDKRRIMENKDIVSYCTYELEYGHDERMRKKGELREREREKRNGREI